ncbi:hypothetical protein Tco_0524136 [Tanacetum coccineum]
MMTFLEASSFSILDVQSFILFTSDGIAEALSEIFRLILCTSSACIGSILTNASTPPSKLRATEDTTKDEVTNSESSSTQRSLLLRYKDEDMERR